MKKIRKSLELSPETVALLDRARTITSENGRVAKISYSKLIEEFAQYWINNSTPDDGSPIEVVESYPGELKHL